MQFGGASSLFLYLQRKPSQNFLGSPVDIKPRHRSTSHRTKLLGRQTSTGCFLSRAEILQKEQKEQKEPCEQESCQPPHCRALGSQYSAARQLCLNILFRKRCCSISMKKQSVAQHWRLAAGSSSGPNFCGDSDSFTQPFPHFLSRQRLY